jgi:hypothetical protein
MNEQDQMKVKNCRRRKYQGRTVPSFKISIVDNLGLLALSTG